VLLVLVYIFRLHDVGHERRHVWFDLREVCMHITVITNTSYEHNTKFYVCTCRDKTSCTCDYSLQYTLSCEGEVSQKESFPSFSLVAGLLRCLHAPQVGRGQEGGGGSNILL